MNPLQAPPNYSALSGLPAPNLNASFAQLGNTISGIRARNSAQQAKDQYLEAVKRAYDTGDFNSLNREYPMQTKMHGDMEDGVRKERFDEQSRILYAMENDPSVAESILDELILAKENSGLDASGEIALRDEFKTNPDKAVNDLSFSLSTLDPERWGKVQGEIRDKAGEIRAEAGEKRSADLAPSKLSDSQSKAFLSGVEAQFSKAFKAEDLEAKRMSNRLNSIKAESAREDNELERKKKEFEYQEGVRKLNEDLTDSMKATRENISGYDRTLKTMQRALPAGFWRKSFNFGPIMGVVPTLQPGSYNLEAIIETLQSQVITMQMKEMRKDGRLTNDQLSYLEKSIGNLDPRQSPKELWYNIRQIGRFLVDARNEELKILARDEKEYRKRFGGSGGEPSQETLPENMSGRSSIESAKEFLKSSGGGVSPTSVAEPPLPDEIEELLKRYGGV